MTGNPQLNGRQQTLLRQAEKCRELAARLRAWQGTYDQNDEHKCVIMHMGDLGRADYGIDPNSWDLIGFTDRNYDRCAHDGTPTGAAAWLEQHALKLEAQV